MFIKLYDTDKHLYIHVKSDEILHMVRDSWNIETRIVFKCDKSPINVSETPDDIMQLISA